MGIRSEEMESLDEKAPDFFDRIWTHKPELYLDRNRFNPSMLHIEVSENGVAYVNGLIKTRSDRERLVNIVKLKMLTYSPVCCAFLSAAALPLGLISYF